MNVVLFSGGLDSTFVLQELLKNNDIRNVKLFTVRLMNNDEFLPPNELSRELLKIELEKLYPHITFNYIENKMQVIVSTKYEIDNQTFIWIYNVAHTFSDADVYFGFTIDDLHTQGLIDDTTEIVKIVNRNKTPKGNVKLHFPLLNTSKPEIFNNINPNLRVLTISCQNPKKLNKFWVSCGQCKSCQLDKKYTIFQPKIFDTENKIIKVLKIDEILNDIKNNTYDFDIVECYAHYIIKMFHQKFDITSDFIKNNITSEIFDDKQVELLKFYYEVKK